MTEKQHEHFITLDSSRDRLKCEMLRKYMQKKLLNTNVVDHCLFIVHL